MLFLPNQSSLLDNTSKPSSFPFTSLSSSLNLSPPKYNNNMDEWKRSGQIPAFGDWDRANELPITQYFECARQAGLIRFSNSSGECDRYMRGDLYSADFKKPSSLHDNNYNNLAPPRKATMLKENTGTEAQMKEQKKQLQRKVSDVTETPRRHHHHRPQRQNYYKSYDGNKDNGNNDSVVPPRPVRNPKPVDEDLYKIPPELLRNSKRKKVPGFFSCLVPACGS